MRRSDINPGTAVHRWPRITAIVLLAVVMAACGGDDPETIVEEATERDQPEIVLGQPFEGTAVVDDVLSPRAFRFFDTLVVSAEPVDAVEGEWTLVRGTVRRWEPDVLSSDLGVEFDESVRAADDELVIVAHQVEPAPEDDVETIPY